MVDFRLHFLLVIDRNFGILPLDAVKYIYARIYSATCTIEISDTPPEEPDILLATYNRGVINNKNVSVIISAS